MQEAHVELIDLGCDPVLGLHITAETWSQQEMPRDTKQSVRDKAVILTVSITKQSEIQTLFIYNYLNFC